MATLMEGSFGSQIEKYVGKTVDGHPLWSARFLVKDQDICVLAHQDLIRAGTEILTTASYQASVDGFMKHMGLTQEEAIEAIKNSVRFAKKAVKLEEQITGKKINIKIAGSVGPYGAFLHDGSDYTGSYYNKISRDELVEWHRSRFEALVEEGVDLIGFETIPALVEAEALIQLLSEYPMQKAWISFSCKDEKCISSGETFFEAAKRCWQLGQDQLIAVGVNCLSPDLVIPLFSPVRAKLPEIPLIAYPNSGETYDIKKKQWVDKNTSLSLTDYTHQWLDLGVKFIGGCCRTYDSDVATFAKEIKTWLNRSK